MADRKDWYFRQIVAEDELDSAFAELEQADRDIVKDTSIGEDVDNKAEFGGITEGFAISITSASARTIQITSGTAYDKDGQRIHLDATTALALTNIGVTGAGAGGTPDGAATGPPSGEENWLAVFIVFDRLLSDARLDGNSQQVYFERDESFHFEVTTGAPGTSPVGTPAVDGSTREDGKILIGDVKIKNDSFSTFLDSVDISRRERFFNVTGSPQSIAKDGLRDVLKTLLENYNAHVSDTQDVHTLSGLSYAGGPTWADGTANPPTDVESHLDNLISHLASVDGATSTGAAKIGVQDSTGLNATPNQAQTLDLASGTLEDQIQALQVAVNGRIFRGGDNAIGGDLLPSVTGWTLGASTQRWDLITRDLDISGSVVGDFYPASTDTLGRSANPWENAYLRNLNVSLDATVRILYVTMGADIVDGLSLHGALAMDGGTAIATFDIAQFIIQSGCLTIINGDLDLKGDVTFYDTGILTVDCLSNFTQEATFWRDVTFNYPVDHYNTAWFRRAVIIEPDSTAPGYGLKLDPGSILGRSPEYDVLMQGMHHVNNIEQPTIKFDNMGMWHDDSQEDNFANTKAGVTDATFGGPLQGRYVMASPTTSMIETGYLYYGALYMASPTLEADGKAYIHGARGVYMNTNVAFDCVMTTHGFNRGLIFFGLSDHVDWNSSSANCVGFYRDYDATARDYWHFYVRAGATIRFHINTGVYAGGTNDTYHLQFASKGDDFRYWVSGKSDVISLNGSGSFASNYMGFLSTALSRGGSGVSHSIWRYRCSQNVNRSKT